MAKRLNIATSEELEGVLKDQPIEWAQVIAVRITLCIFPLANQSFQSKRLSFNRQSNLLSVTARACYIAWINSIFPSHIFKRGTSTASTAVSLALALTTLAATDTTTFVSDAPSTDAALATLMAFDSALATFSFINSSNTAALASKASSRAVAHASLTNNVIWKQISADISSLQSGTTPTALASSPLWPDGEPEWAAKERRALFALPIDDFDVWQNWYQRISLGKSPFGFGAKADEALSLKIATQDDAFWDRDFGVVNGEIKGWIEEARAEFYSASETNEDDLPKSNPIGIQTTKAIDGPLKPIGDGKSKHDPEQNALYEEMREQLQQLLDNTPSQILGDNKQLIERFLSHPANFNEVDLKKMLWLHGNRLRNLLARHDQAMQSDDMHFNKLAPEFSEALRDPLETWNVLVVGDPILRQRDQERLGPRERDEINIELIAANPFLEKAKDNRKIIDPELAIIIELEQEIAEQAVQNIHNDQATVLAAASNRNIAAETLSGAYKTARNLSDPKTSKMQKAIGVFSAAFIGAAGVATFDGVTVGLSNGWQYVEFIALNSELFKDYLSIAFSKSDFSGHVDYIVQVYRRFKASNSKNASKGNPDEDRNSTS